MILFAMLSWKRHRLALRRGERTSRNFHELHDERLLRTPLLANGWRRFVRIFVQAGVQVNQRLEVIREMLAEPIGSTTASNQALGWRSDCEYLLATVDELSADLKACEPHLCSLASSCEACWGTGEIIDSEDMLRPCEHCQPVRNLAERINPTPPPAPVHAEAEYDIPF